MFQISTEQKVCEVGGVKFGGQPGEYPCVCVSSIFQKGDKVFKGKRKEGFDEKKAEELLKTQERLTEETGVPGMADVVANTGEEFKLFIDFVSSTSNMPFCIDAWVMKPKLAGAAYCAEKGLLDRMFYNSLTVWETDLETEIREIAQIGVKHVLLVAFDQEDQMPSGRITGTQKLLDAIEKVGAKFESIFVDTSVMNGPATALCGVANRMIKEKWGFPTASAPSNGSYMDLKRFKDMWQFKGWSSTDAALESLSAFFLSRHDFFRPHGRRNTHLAGGGRGRSLFGHGRFAETKQLPKDPNHPLFKLFPDFVEQLKSLA